MCVSKHEANNRKTSLQKKYRHRSAVFLGGLFIPKILVLSECFSVPMAESSMFKGNYLYFLTVTQKKSNTFSSQLSYF